MKIDALLKAKQAWQVFSANHPNFPPFLSAVKAHGITEGTQITITVQYPDGQEMKAGLKVKASDLELINMAQNM